MCINSATDNLLRRTDMYGVSSRTKKLSKPHEKLESLGYFPSFPTKVPPSKIWKVGKFGKFGKHAHIDMIIRGVLDL